MLKKAFLFRTVLALPAITFSPAFAEHPNVFHNVPEAQEQGYQILYELDPPVDGGFRDATPVPYRTDNSAIVPAFDRVAYYLELTNGSGTNWVFVSMEAFTANARELGLPHNLHNPVKHQRTVRNMNVFSNVGGIATGTFIDTGNIEMWPSNYSTTDGNGVFAADENAFDWGDGNATTDSGYGSFQIHNSVAGQTILAYNRWGGLGGGDDDLGIGNQPSGHPDWTFSTSAATYSARKLVILVRPRTFDISFTQLPRDRQLYSRNPATGKATVAIAGKESFGGFDRIVLRVFRNDAFLSETSHPLTYQNGDAGFSFNPEIEAEMAKYDFELLLENHGGRRTVELVRDVVAGDAYIFYGQSNAEAADYDPSRSANEYASEWLLTFGQNADDGTKCRNILYWVQAEGDGNMHQPASIGQWAMVLGRELIDAYGVPIAILNGARGGYSMPQLQKDRDNPDELYDGGGVTRTYNRLRYRALEAEIAASARAMFFYQGESDVDNAPAHADGFARLYEDWSVDYPGLEHFYVTQVRPGCGVSTNNVALRDVQRRFEDQYPSTSVMASNGLASHDGCHFMFTAGYEDLGWHHFRQVARDLYGAPDDPNIDALNPAYVEFSREDRTALRLVLRNQEATIGFPEGALVDFELTGTSATITGRTVLDNTIVFHLSESADPGSVLEYRSHLGDGQWVTNNHGVGMLSFAEPVLEASGTSFEMWLANSIPDGYSDASDGDPDRDGLRNLLEYALGLNPMRPDLGAGHQPRVKRDGGMLEVTYRRAVDPNDIAVQLENSTDLEGWTAISDAWVEDDGSLETRRHSMPVPENGQSLFFRLRVTLL